MNRVVLFVAAVILGTVPLVACTAASGEEPLPVRAFQPENEQAYEDVPVYITRIYAERFFRTLAASCPDAGVGDAPGAPAATLFVSAPTVFPNPGHALTVQSLKANEVGQALGDKQAEEDARQVAASSRCEPAALKRMTGNMVRYLSDPRLAGSATDTLVSQCKSRPNRWDGQPCDCLGNAIDMASTPRSRQYLVDDFWGWQAELIAGDSRLYNLTVLACTQTSPMAERKPSYDQLDKSDKLLSSSRDTVGTALTTMIRSEGITLSDEVARPLYHHADPLWMIYGEPSLMLSCFYGRNSDSDNTFVVIFWKNRVFLSRAEFARLSPQHPLMLAAEMVRESCPEVDEAKEIRAASHRAAKDLGYF